MKSQLGNVFQRLMMLLVMLVTVLQTSAFAHPLGNFTINHFVRIQPDERSVHIRYVIDMAEISAFQTTQGMKRNAEGKLSLDAYLDDVTSQYVQGLLLSVDGVRVQLRPVAKSISMPLGSGGLPTLRLEFDLEGEIKTTSQVISFHFEDLNDSERVGWHELVLSGPSNTSIFNTASFGSPVTDELKSYPNDMLAAPLNERTADFSFTRGAPPPGATALRTRDGRSLQSSRDRFVELISVPELTPALVLFGLLFAMVLGAFHALSPGHGKTVVGAYLVGTRGTVRHAAFLGLTVTITHTAGVFALGLVTLAASHYILPERLFSWLSLISGLMVVAIGGSLLVKRLAGVFDQHEHSHTHSDGGHTHSHLPPGADGTSVTWKSLLALGISGGVLPCPSALVVLLAAISLHRVAYGLLLVFAFSVGLASVLTAIGMLFVYAGRILKTSTTLIRLSRVLPLASALVITCAGLLICYQTISQSGFNLFSVLHPKEQSLSSLGTMGVLILGLVYGLKHATEADHIVAVSTIVSEHKKLFRAALVGALWGAGHTASLVVVGAIVLVLKIAIPEQMAGWLEFGVALMIIALGVLAFRRALKGRNDVHFHPHRHGPKSHLHLHFHGGDVEEHSHEAVRIGPKPMIVGAVHGLAGSATLTLLVLTQIGSPIVGLIYLAIFGVGSILGMLIMSGLVGLPFVFGAKVLGGVSYRMQMVAGLLSVVFGIWYAYQVI